MISFYISGWAVRIKRRDGSEFLATTGSQPAVFHDRAAARNFAEQLKGHHLKARAARFDGTVTMP